jgi:hypothetical protein
MQKNVMREKYFLANETRTALYDTDGCTGGQTGAFPPWQKPYFFFFFFLGGV